MGGLYSRFERLRPPNPRLFFGERSFCRLVHVDPVVLGHGGDRNPGIERSGIGVMGQDVEFLLRQLRAEDHPRYILCLLAPKGKRRALAALYAFNLEISHIRDRVGEPLIRRMRLRFWRDALDDVMAGKPPGHPMAKALADIARRFDLTRADLSALIDVRELEFSGDQPTSMEDAIGRCRDQGGALHKMAAKILAGGDEPNHLEAAAMAGTAWAVVGLIRSVPFDASAGLCRLPVALCQAHGLDPNRARSPESAKALSLVLNELGEAASKILRQAGEVRWRKAAGPSIMIGYLAAVHIKRLRKVGFDLRRAEIADLLQGHRLSPSLMARLWWRINVSRSIN